MLSASGANFSHEGLLCASPTHQMRKLKFRDMKTLTRPPQLHTIVLLGHFISCNEAFEGGGEKSGEKDINSGLTSCLVGLDSFLSKALSDTLDGISGVD